jgi:hypothetical protein
MTNALRASSDGSVSGHRLLVRDLADLDPVRPEPVPGERVDEVEGDDQAGFLPPVQPGGASFEGVDSPGKDVHRGLTEIPVALGDVATRRGETGSAADHYRRAAEALQDVRW